jgi:AcrR family transcriptional regulator
VDEPEYGGAGPERDERERARPQQARSRDKVDRVLAAAAAVLGELPYDEVGTRLIAERAGVSVGTLYRFFPDKDSIGRALLLRWLEDFTSIVDQIAAGPLPAGPAEFFGQLVDAYAGFFRTEPGFRNIFYHAPRTPDLRDAQHRNDIDVAARLHGVLVSGYGMVPEGLATRCLIAVQVADFLIGLAFRDQPAGDATVLAEADRLLCLYLGL